MKADQIVAAAIAMQTNTQYPLTPLVLGNAGIGKTTRIASSARKAGYTPVVMTYDSLLESIERIPSIADGESVVTIDASFKNTVLSGDSPCCLIIDEMQQSGNASLSSITLLRQLLLERVILNTHKIPTNTLIVLLGNTAGHAGTSQELHELLPQMLWQNLVQLTLDKLSPTEWATDYMGGCPIAVAAAGVLGSTFPETFPPRAAEQLVHMFKQMSDSHQLDTAEEVMIAFAGKQLGSKLASSLRTASNRKYLLDWQREDLMKTPTWAKILTLAHTAPNDVVQVITKIGYTPTAEERKACKALLAGLDKSTQRSLLTAVEA